MSDENDKGSKWGGLIKGIVAGAAIVAGIAVMAPETFSSLFTSSGGESALSGLLKSETFMSGIGTALRYIAGGALAITGLSYLLGDKGQSENADRHAQSYNEAKESFAIREDMRKMQAVMMMRMKASGHEPAMAMAAQQGR